MIICPNPHPDYPGEWILVKQSDHDDHCGYISTHWTAGPFWKPTHPRLLTLAVGMHDTGSANWEDAPIVSPQGIPWSYWTIPPDDHIALHRLGVEFARTVHPYVGLLISMHVAGIHRDRLDIDPTPNRWHIPKHDTPKVNAFVAEQTEIQKALRSELTDLGAPLSDSELMNDFKIFEVIDILSTQFSACGLAEREMTYVPDADGNAITMSLKRAGEWEFRVSPFPFDGDRFDVPCVARHMPVQVFRDNDEYREAWYRAPMITLPYACVR